LERGFGAVEARKEGSSARTLLFPLVPFGILWKEGGYCCDLATKLVGFESGEAVLVKRFVRFDYP
jgi:hypothetical protein